MTYVDIANGDTTHFCDLLNLERGIEERDEGGVEGDGSVVVVVEGESGSESLEISDSHTTLRE